MDEARSRCEEAARELAECCEASKDYCRLEDWSERGCYETVYFCFMSSVSPPPGVPVIIL